MRVGHPEVLHHLRFLQPNHLNIFVPLFQDKLTKEVNFILANQETIQSQITHLDDAIKQMEVNFFYAIMYLCTDPLIGPPEACCCTAALMGVLSRSFLPSSSFFSPGQQYRGGPSPLSLCPRAGGGCSRAAGRSDRGPGGLPLEERRGPRCSALGEEEPAGAGRPDGLHAGAAQGDRRTLLRPGCQDHSQEVAAQLGLEGPFGTGSPTVSLRLLLLHRLAKAIEKLQCFSLAADPSFRHFHSDASKEVKLIRGLEFIRGRPLC